VRILGEEAEAKLYALEAARGWKRSGLVSAEQLAACEKELGALPAQAGWAIRLLLFGFALTARGAFNAFFTLTMLGGSSWGSSASGPIGAYYLVSAVPLYLLGEWLIRNKNLYRFGIEEGVLAGAIIQFCMGLTLTMNFHSFKFDELALVVGIPAALACAWYYARFGYLYALYAAAAAFLGVVLSQCTSFSANELRALTAMLLAGLLAVSSVRGEPGDHDRLGWQSFQGALFMLLCFIVNLRLERLVDLSRVDPPGSGAFYWLSLAAVLALGPLAVAWGLRRRHRPMVAAGAIAALVGLVSVKPYLGLPRHSWDPAVLGIALMSLSLYFKRWLDSGKDGQRDGFTAKPLIVGREDGPGLGALLAAATAAGAAGGSAAAPQEKGFKGQGGSSGGAGASGGF
jgi:uncharacterized membrane protein YgcG